MERNNKGYTLVEVILSMALLIIIMAQIGNIIFNTSLLYRKGNSEVTLQAEAQQLIQQFEEIAIDCDDKITYDPASYTININNKATSTYLNSYSITLNPVTHIVNLTVKSPTGNVTQVMAENVASIGLNMSQYNDASKIAFSVVMDNGEYTYSATKDIYFRNSIGENDGGNVAPPTEADYIVMNILRFKTYNLKNEISSDDKTKYGLTNCTFKYVSMDDGINVNPYTISDDGKTIKCTKTYCGEKNGTPVGSYVYFQSTEKSNVYLKCYSEDVSLGFDYNGTYGVAPINIDTCKGNALNSYVTATGISLEDCTDFTVTPMIRFFTSRPLTVGGKVYKYYSIYSELEQKLLTPPCVYSVDEVNGVPTSLKNMQADKKEIVMSFYDDEVCLPMFPSKSGSVSTPINGTSWSGKFIAILLVEGYEGAPLSTKEEIFQKLNEEGFKSLYQMPNPWSPGNMMDLNKGSIKDMGQYKFKFDLPADAFKIEPGLNAIKVSTNKFHIQDCDGVYKINTALGKMTDFYKAGGEIFFTIRVHYDYESSNYNFDCKGLLSVTCTDSNHVSCRNNAVNSDPLALGHYNAAYNTGMSANVSQSGDGWSYNSDNNVGYDGPGEKDCNCFTKCSEPNKFCPICKDDISGCLGSDNIKVNPSTEDDEDSEEGGSSENDNVDNNNNDNVDNNNNDNVDNNNNDNVNNNEQPSSNVEE